MRLGSAMQHHTWTSKSGLTVVGEQHPHMKSVSLGFFVKTGSRDEPKQLNGVSHFLEHMMFKGSRTRSGEEIDETFDRLGAEYNAFTGFEYTGYYARVLPEHLETLFELQADMMHPALRKADFETEKKVILEEIALYEDQPSSVLQRQAIQLYYGDHPLGQDILGSSASIRALTAEQMQNYHREHYVPGNITLAWVGNADPAQVQALAQRFCSAWEPGAAPRVHATFSPMPHEQQLHRGNVARTHAVILCPAPAYQDPHSEAMDLLVDVLGHGGNSRLYWALVDKGLVDYAGASYQAQDGVGMVGVSLSCDPQQTASAMRIVQDEIKRLLSEGISQQELDSARNRVLTSLAVEGEQSLRRLFSVAFDALYDRPYRSLSQVLAAYEHVSLEDVHRLMKEYPFAPQTVVTLSPGSAE